MPRSGVSIENPEYEWRDIAKEYHLSFEDFIALPIEQQESMIAHHRVSVHTQAVLNKDALDKSERAPKKPHTRSTP